MSRLEDATPAEGRDRSAPAAAGGPPQANPIACTGREAVAAAARAACGAGAVTSPAAADGVVLAGGRAAVLALDRSRHAEVRPRGPWTWHAVGAAGTAPVLAVDLVADSVQAAADQVLLAQVVARRTGKPVSCRIECALAESVALARIPDRTAAESLMAASAPADEAPSAAVVLAACDAAAAALGRPITGTVTVGDDEARTLTWDGSKHAFGKPGEPRRDAAATAALRIGAAPSSAGARDFLLDLAARVGRRAPIAIRPVETHRDVVAQVWSTGADPDAFDRLDALVVADPSWLARPDVVGAVRDGADVVVLGAAGDPAEILGRLPASAVDALVEGRVRLTLSPAAEPLDAFGAIAAVLRWPGAWLDGDPLAAIADEAEAARVRAAARAARTVDPAEGVRGETTFATAPEGPFEPPADPADDVEGWRERVRRFHVGAGPGAAAWPAPGFVPAAVLAHGSSDRGRRHGGPLFVHVGDDGLEGRSFRCWLREFLGDRLSEFPVLSGHLDLLAHAAGRAVSTGPGVVPVGEAFDAFAEIVRRGLDVTAAGAEARDAELERLRRALPGDATLVRPDAGAPVALYLRAVGADREPRRRAFADEVRALAAGLRERLQVDEGHRAASADALRDAGLGDAFFDAGALSGHLGARRGPKSMDAAERARVERAAGALEAWLRDADDEPAVVLVHDGALPAGPTPDGTRVVDHDHPLEVAQGLFDGLAASHVELFRAVRTARLELERAYDPALHDAALARMDASGLTSEEAYVLPTVAVVLSADRLRDAGVAAFSGLLRSGRPVHVLLGADPLATDAGASFATHATGLGYVAAAHREAFVLESTLDRPRHLARGLRALVSVLRPAAAVVAVPPDGERRPDRRLAAALAGRAAVCFRYDASRGTTWADRFDLDGNPQPERPWPRHDLAYRDADGNERTRSCALTWADAVALDPGRRDRFLLVPRAAWSDDQVELAEWIALPDGERRRKIPYVLAVREDGELARAIVERGVARETEDRLRAWRTLQELAGTDNEHARRAAEEARREALAEAEALRDALAREKDEEIERARTGAAAEAMDRLVASLMNLDALPALAPSARKAPAEEAAETAPAAEAPPKPHAPDAAEEARPAEADDDLVLDEAYIDSVLCTSCQECININPQLFRYDGNKQAFIADLAAGTFEQLVRAAEKCPARCIHPGAPRAGDDTATDELVARAAKFA